jgi:hypothetical protein
VALAHVRLERRQLAEELGAAPMKAMTPYIQSASVASSASRPFHFGSAKLASVAGSSSRLTLPVL